MALLSANPGHLAGACAQLARLDPPAVVSPKPSRTLVRVLDNVDPEHHRPARLLERHSEHRRIQALAVLTAVADILHGLHPAELAWIAEKAGGPHWFLAAAAAVPVPEDEDDGAVRLVGDEEVGKHPDPAAVLQSWLDSPADEVLARHEPEIALTILLEHCGRSTKRWEALAAAMTFDYDDEKITFGQLLDSLNPTPARAHPS
ncbi:hypothetical protein [Streptomyces sp. E5N298]|uniref:hypothetical protein n=1 Tax=Streptomyces sp. E5N298 TaxID=1851983 RepID=UPI001EE9A00B|nr:hypothetical protein [Streptomyces sp. E5N298]